MKKTTNLEYKVPSSKGESISLLKASGLFRVDNENSWAKTYYMQASDKMFIDVFNDTIVLSENGGSSILAVICRITVTQLAENESIFKVSFKIGSYSLNVFRNIFFSLMLLAICIFAVNILISILTLFVSIIVLIVWFSKVTIIKKTIRNVVNTLDAKKVKASARL